MFKQDLFELFNQYESLPDEKKQIFINELSQQSPDKAQQLLLLSQDSQNFTEHFLENLTDYSETMSSPNLKTGDIFGVYTLVKPLGVGGMGHVYLAERNDGLIEQQVAIKFLHPALYQLNSTQILLNEAQALANLNHPNIATILNVVKMDCGLIYIVMEYIQGCTLTDYLTNNTLTLNDKLRLFELIADAVQEAHSKRIVHADIKPSNILITEEGKPKLIDFGIMEFIGVQTGESKAFINQYLCAMTVNYAAPEQLQGQQASIQSDVYALGGLLYFILSGKTPFEEIGGTLAEKIKTISEDTIPPCSINHKVKFKSDLDWILQTALAKQPAQRFRSVGALTVEVSNYVNNLPLSGQSSSIYKFIKSWQRHKIAYALSVMLFTLVSLFATKTWYDNIHIQQSYEELTSSYLNQYTSLQEVNNKTDVIKLPSPDAVPIELYIKLAFQKYEQESIIEESQTEALATIKRLKKVLVKKGFTDKKWLKLVEFREDCINIFDDDNTARKCKNLIQTLLTPEEKIDMLYLLANELDIKILKKEFSTILKQVDKSLATNSILPLSQIKYNLVKAAYYSSFHSVSNINPAHFSNLAFSIAHKNADLVPSHLYLDTLFTHIRALENNTGYTMEYLDFLNHAKTYMSHIQFSDKNRIAVSVLAAIKRMELFQHINSYRPISREQSLNPNSDDELLNEIYYLQTNGDFDKATETLKLLRKHASDFYGSSYSSLIGEDTLITEQNLKKGNVKESSDVIKNRLLPYYNKNYSDDWTASQLLRFCIPLSYHLAAEAIELYCKQPYYLMTPILGEFNFHTDYTLNQLVWWYGLNPITEEEHNHVKRLESLVADSINFFKIKQLESLVFYFISRANIEKANYYLELLDKTIKDYAGDMYVVYIDTSKTFRAEVKLLEGHRNIAIKLLKEVANNVCKYQPKNYLRMHLNQVAGKAGITDTCSTTFL
jgi:serine/threonine protein kinase